MLQGSQQLVEPVYWMLADASAYPQNRARVLSLATLAGVPRSGRDDRRHIMAATDPTYLDLQQAAQQRPAVHSRVGRRTARSHRFLEMEPPHARADRLAAAELREFLADQTVVGPPVQRQRLGLNLGGAEL
jgi:hypothetical protein